MLTESILLDRIPELKRVYLFDQIESTNDFAKQLLTDGVTPFPALIYTPNQTKGRGRGNNRWVSSRGSLTFSFILPAPMSEGRPLDSILWGMAIARGLMDVSSQLAVCQVKWPNDVLAGGRKVAGILIETVAAQPNALIVGIGINLNNQVMCDSAGEDLSAATSLFDLTQQESDPADLLESIWRHHRQIHRLDPPQIVEAFSALDFLSQKRIKIDTPHGVLKGWCQGIDPAGALQLQIGLEKKQITSGSNIEVLPEAAV